MLWAITSDLRRTSSSAVTTFQLVDFMQADAGTALTSNFGHAAQYIGLAVLMAGQTSMSYKTSFRTEKS